MLVCVHLVNHQQLELANIAAKLVSSKREAVLTLLTTDEKPTTVPEAYLKLHLLSHRLVKPHEINLEGIFASLPNIAWTSDGPIDLEELPEKQLLLVQNGQ